MKMSPQRRLWTAFALVAAILIIPPLTDVIEKYADPPDGPKTTTRLIMCAKAELGIYDAEIGGKCRWGGVPMLMDSATIEMMYKRIHEMDELGAACPSVPVGARDITIEVLTPPDRPDEKDKEPEPDFFDDPIGKTLDGTGWFLDKALNALTFTF